MDKKSNFELNENLEGSTAFQEVETKEESPNFDTYEDLMSSSQKQPPKENIANAAKEALKKASEVTSNAVEVYSSHAVTQLDRYIKAISFIVAIAVLLIFLTIAVVLFVLDNSFLLVSMGVAIIGVIVAMMCLFLIYGLGHIITQNNELLSRRK